MTKPNINIYWDYVKTLYPDARFDFWYRSGELHFWPNGEAEANGESTWGCVADGDSFRIMTPDEI